MNRDAPILCCTAEVLANIALREGPDAAIDDVVMDEFHYYADRDRGVAWQVPLLTMPQTRFLLMSATLGDTRFFEDAVTRLNGRATVTVKSGDRPVPLEYAYSEMPLAQTIEKLVDEGKTPVYVVHFTQADAAQQRAGLHQPQDLHPGAESRDRGKRSPASRSAAPTAPTSANGSGTASACITRGCSPSTACSSSSSRRRDC